MLRYALQILVLCAIGIAAFVLGMGTTRERNKKSNKEKEKTNHDTKIAALEQAIEEQKQIIASTTSKKDTPLPPKAGKDPLKPLSGFTQHGDN